MLTLDPLRGNFMADADGHGQPQACGPRQQSWGMKY
jgi:hypothetical protein